jgi:2-keto-4-pentenoate hydratase
MNSINATATFLANLRATHERITKLPDDLRLSDFETAYAVQSALVDLLAQQHGGQRSGYKAACTNQVAQQQLNISGPLFGALLSHSTYHSPVRLRADTFSTRIIEAEFGFQMATDVPASSTPYTASSVVEFVGEAFPGIEIVSHRFVDWTKAGALSLVGDNAIHGAYVRGKPYRDWRTLDLATHQAQVIVNGRVVATGQGSAVLGHPLNVIAWLANELPKYERQLKRGDYITTGTCVEVYPAQTGDAVRVEFGVMGSVEVEFD